MKQHIQNIRFLFITLVIILIAPSLVISAEKNTSKQELVILNWSEYMDPALVKKFETLHNVVLKPIYYQSDDYRDNYMLEIQGKGIDIIVINGAKIRTYVNQNWIGKLTVKEVPNLKYIDKRWLSMYEKSKGYVIPYFWGTTGIAYRKDLVKHKIDSWKDLFNPAEAQRGKISMIGAHRDLIGLALKSLGYSINSTSFSEMTEAKKLLLNQKKYVKGYNYLVLDKSSSMLNGELEMSMGYNGDILSLSKHNKNITYVVPKEGTALWVDFMVVSKTSVNKKLAYKFFNFMNKPKNAAQQAMWTKFATPNLAAKKLLPKDFLANELIYPPKSVLDKSEIYKRLPPRVTRFRNEIFSVVTQ